MTNQVREAGSREQVTARRSLVVAGWTLVSRATGLLRVLVVGALMGPTYLANVFQAGYVLPGNVFTIVAGPVLAMVLVPLLVRARESGEGRAAQLLGRISGRLFRVAATGGAALAVASPALAWTLVAGVPDAERGRAWLLTLVLILFVAPQVPLFAAASLGIAAQQARGRFGLAAAAPALESVGIIATVVVATRIYGTGLGVSAAPLGMMVLLGLGSTGAIAMHAGLQLWGASRAGLAVRPRRGWRGDAEAGDALRRLVRSIPVAANSTVANYSLSVVAATVPGGVLVLQLSTQAYYALSSLGARSVATATLPELSAARDDLPRFGRQWRRGLYLAFVAATAPLCLLVAFAAPVAELLALGEMAGSPLVGALAACLAVAAVAQLVLGIRDLGQQALFARLDDRGPTIASMLGMATTLVTGFSALALPADARLVALLFAILAGEVVAAVTVLARLRNAVRPEPLTTWGTGLVLAAAVAMVPALTVGRHLAGPQTANLLVEAALVGLTGLVALAMYVGVLRVGAPRLAPRG